MKKNLNIIFVALLPLIFYFAVTVLVAHNTHSLCLFKIITEHDCWGCGMTRAFNALFNLQFREAFEFNPRIVIVAPLMYWIWNKTLIKLINTSKVSEK